MDGNKRINILSLFDGMSCGQIALNRLGIRDYTYYASEIDKYAIKVTQHNYPNTIQLGDVTKVSAKDLPPIDLIMGGSPCQGFSFAGKQLAFDDPRSALFFEFIRILNEAREINPNVKFLLENVKMKKEHELVITRYLNVAPIEINSALVSAQNRERLYWTNIANEPYGLFGDMRCTIPQPEDKNIKLNNIITDNSKSDIDKAYCIDANYFKGTNIEQYQTKKRRQIVFTETGFRMLNIDELKALQTVPEWYNMSIISRTQAVKMLGNGWTVDVIAHILKHHQWTT